MGPVSLEKGKLFKHQNYGDLLKQHKKLNTVFNDTLFPPSNISFGSEENVPSNVEWKRPKDLCTVPHLFDADVASKTVACGELSSDWLVSAFSILAGVPELCHKVVPNYRVQELNLETGDNYVGLLHFQFWRFGQWVDVVVDDLLPTVNNTLLFTQSCHENEFWISLAEKAYAKLHGSYEALQSGHLSDALVDFTGGVSEILDLRAKNYLSDEDNRSTLFELIQDELKENTLLCATIPVTDDSPVGTRTEMGLSVGQAYPITSAKKVHLGETSLRKILMGREKVALLRLRDPRGEPRRSSKSGEDTMSGVSYAYSTSKLTRLLSSNPAWAQLKESDRVRMGLNFEEEGEFWIPMEDFVSQFHELTICRLLNTNPFVMSRTWHESSIRGQWVTGSKDTTADRSGGSIDFPDTFLRNPQYMFDIRKHEEELVIQTLQWDSDLEHQVLGMQRLLIGFSIIKVEENRKYRMHKLWDHCPALVTVNPMRKREVYYRGFIPQGRYIILPATHKPGDVGAFLLRIFSSANIKLREVKKHMPSSTWLLNCICHPVTWVTVVTIKGAEDLKKANRFGSCDPYCIIKSEGKKCETPVVRNSVNPVWNSSFVFYRKNMEEPVLIKIYNSNTVLWDNFLGLVRLPAPLNHQPTQLRAELLGKDKTTPTQGELVLEILTEDNFFAV